MEPTPASAPEPAAVAGSLDRLRQAKGFIFDMDGVLYLGTRPLPGVSDMFNALRVRGIPFMLATNNSTLTRQEFVDRLGRMDIAVSPEQIQTSSTATRDYLQRSPDVKDNARVYVVGMPSVTAILQEGTSLVMATEDDEPESIDVVVVGLDFGLTYDKMKRAVAAIDAGAMFVATNADDRIPNEHGHQPGAGACVAGIERAARKAPIVIGKPQSLLMTTSVEQFGCAPHEAVMVGDRVDTDIVAAKNAGLMTALVLTGLTQRDDLARASVLPDFVFADLPALMQGFVGHD